MITSFGEVMRKLRTRKDQLLYFVDLLYKENPELPKSAN